MKRTFLNLALGAIVLLVLAGCDNMRDNNRYKPYEETPFFENGSTARELVEGTVPRGFLRADKHLYEGKTKTGEFADTFPFPITEQTLARGKERYNIYCIVCHGATGAGDGMVVRRGYKKPVPFQDAGQKSLPAGQLYDVIANGSGVMAAFKTELSPEDRWAVAAYVQTLQQIDTGVSEKKA